MFRPPREDLSFLREKERDKILSAAFSVAAIAGRDARAAFALSRIKNRKGRRAPENFLLRCRGRASLPVARARSSPALREYRTTRSFPHPYLPRADGCARENRRNRGTI